MWEIIVCGMIAGSFPSIMPAQACILRLTGWGLKYEDITLRLKREPSFRYMGGL